MDINKKENKLLERIKEEALSIETGNLILDDFLKEKISANEYIPHFLQVIQAEEISKIKKEGDIDVIRIDLQRKLCESGDVIMVPIGPRGYLTPIFQKTTLPAPYFDKIANYCTYIGKNNYQKR